MAATRSDLEIGLLISLLPELKSVDIGLFAQRHAKYRRDVQAISNTGRALEIGLMSEHAMIGEHAARQVE